MTQYLKQSKECGATGDRTYRLFQAKANLVVTFSRIQDGFSDASEDAYPGVVYLRMINSSLVMLKSKVSPVKRLSIPRLELCGAQILAKLLHHVQGGLHVHVPLSNIYDSTPVCVG